MTNDKCHVSNDKKYDENLLTFSSTNKNKIKNVREGLYRKRYSQN